MIPVTVKGVVAPVFTPTNEDSTLNYKTIPKYVEFLSYHGIKAVLVAGTSGEGMSLKVEERKQLAEAWIQEARPRGIQVIVQVGGAPLPDVLELAKHAEDNLADGILTLPELYFKPKTAEDLVTYLLEVSRVAPSIPLLYYHFPMMSGVEVDLKKFFKQAVARIPNFCGLKADLDVALQVADQLTDAQVVFNGNHLLAPAALLNHESSIATVTNLFPGLVIQILDAIKNSDVQQARLLQEKLNVLVDGIASQGAWVPAMKYAAELVTGLKLGPPRLPLRALTDEQKMATARHLRDMGIEVFS